MAFGTSLACGKGSVFWMGMAYGAGIDSLSLDHRNGTKLRFLPPNVRLAARIQVSPVLTNETTLL